MQCRTKFGTAHDYKETLTMSSVLIVGGDQIEGIKEVFGSYGIDQVSHWSGRKAGDSNKVIPQNTKVIVLITKWINHSITYKLKRNAVRRGIKVMGLS